MLHLVSLRSQKAILSLLQLPFRACGPRKFIKVLSVTGLFSASGLRLSTLYRICTELHPRAYGASPMDAGAMGRRLRSSNDENPPLLV